MKMIFGDQYPGDEVIQKIREATNAPANVPLGDAVEAAITSRDQQIAELNAQIDAINFDNKWQLIGFDDFTGETVDATQWGDAYSGRGNQGVGWRSPRQVRVTDNELQIVGAPWADSFAAEVKNRIGDLAKQPAATRKALTTGVGGGIAHRVNQTYGRWEIRARTDAGAGYGPAILLWPKGPWPESKEIDIFECPQGDRKKGHFTIHFDKTNQQKGASKQDDFTQWHTFVVEWTPDRVIGFYDGVPVYDTTDAQQIPTGDMHLAIQNDVGPVANWMPARSPSTPPEVALHVDYVKVWKYLGK